MFICKVTKCSWTQITPNGTCTEKAFFRKQYCDRRTGFEETEGSSGYMLPVVKCSVYETN